MALATSLVSPCTSALAFPAASLAFNVTRISGASIPVRRGTGSQTAQLRGARTHLLSRIKEISTSVVAMEAQATAVRAWILRPASFTTAAVNDLLGAFKRHKQTDAYKKAVQNSKKRMDDQERTSRKMWWVNAKLERARILAEQRDDGSLNYYDISCEDQ